MGGAETAVRPKDDPNVSVALWNMGPAPAASVLLVFVVTKDRFAHGVTTPRP